MHPITIRTMKFDVPSAEEFHPLYMAGNSALSYSYTAMGLYAAYAEPFLVKSLRRVLDRIRDEALREDVDRFCRQEAQHYQRHTDFNKVVIAHGYPGLEQRMDALRRDFEGFLEHGTDRSRIGYMEGFEAYTTRLALETLESGLYDHPRTQPAFGELFRWHMLEEFEHRNVAFDVYEHLYGDAAYRAYMCWLAQRHMFRFFDDCIGIMSSLDVRRHGERCRVTPRQKAKLALKRLGVCVRSMLPGSSPHKLRVPDGVAALSAHFTRLAVSVR